MNMSECTPSELMVAVAARELKDHDTVLVGVGIPNLAANLAKKLQAPNLVMVYESGAVGSNPTRMPLSIGDPCLVTGAKSVCSMYEQFAYYLQGGRIDVGFLGGAQIDKYGNINSTVIGSYKTPKVRLPGSGGACDIASNVKKIIVITPHEKRRFVEKVDFLTSPGFVDGKEKWKLLKLQGGGPYAVITNLCTMKFDDVTGEMMVASLHPGVTIEKVWENTPWKVNVAAKLEQTPPPTEREISALRALDPSKTYLG
ncbi:MAG: 3-oxoadipate--succinyl-CoA transferase subunit B [Euryarchaeota archaeon RBG_19FT_COMBO_56_21]|nr:MAG: 3-oxoadipate--succinyl-CoA transferase subunit B [Euryarchaeota archaeon RBG_19FT_COMBO_56_21]